MRAIINRIMAGFAGAAVVVSGPVALGQTAPEPHLTYAFSASIELAAPIEQGTVDGARHRFIAITGGRVFGPRLTGEVMAGGGDWQVIHSGGLTTIEARYFIKAQDGTVIGIVNPGVRTGTAEVIDQLARGEKVDPSKYYFRTTPRFDVPAGPHSWLTRQVFVTSAVRNPTNVMINFYSVS